MAAITWRTLLDKPAPLCGLCCKSLKPSRLSFEEALYLCQTAGCLFPLDSARFDDYVVKLASTHEVPTSAKRATPSNPNGAGHTRADHKSYPNIQSHPSNQQSGPEPFPLYGFDTEISYAEAIDVDPLMLSELLAGSAGDSPTLEPATGSDLVSSAAARLLSDDDDDGAVSDGPPSETTDGAVRVSQLVITAPQNELQRSVSYPEGKNTKHNRPVKQRSVSPPQVSHEASLSPSGVMSTNSSIDTVGQSQSVISNAKRTCPETDDSVDGSASEREDLAAMWDSASDGEEMPAAGDATPTRPSKRPR